jgi:hypothetical protein
MPSDELKEQRERGMITAHLIYEYCMVDQDRRSDSASMIKVAHKTIQVYEMPKEGDLILVDDPIYDYGNDATDMAASVNDVYPGDGCIVILLDSSGFTSKSEYEHKEIRMRDEGWTLIDKINYPDGKNLAKSL